MYDGQNCSMARALEVVGDRWTMLIMRETFRRPRRFDDLQETLGMARNVLTDRLQRLCEDGLLERRLYQERPARYEYAQTAKARDLFPVMVAFVRWGDKYFAPNGPPRLIRHRACGGDVVQKMSCSSCGEELTMEDIESVPGPGAVIQATESADVAGGVGAGS